MASATGVAAGRPRWPRPGPGRRNRKAAAVAYAWRTRRISGHQVPSAEASFREGHGGILNTAAPAHRAALPSYAYPGQLGSPDDRSCCLCLASRRYEPAPRPRQARLAARPEVAPGPPARRRAVGCRVDSPDVRQATETADMEASPEPWIRRAASPSHGPVARQRRAPRPGTSWPQRSYPQRVDDRPGAVASGVAGPRSFGLMLEAGLAGQEPPGREEFPRRIWGHVERPRIPQGPGDGRACAPTRPLLERLESMDRR